MAPKQYSFHFGRVLTTGGYESSNKSDFYDSVFSKNKPISDLYNKYLFLKVQKIDFNHENFFVGRLVKYKTINEEIVNEEEGSIGSSIVDRAVVSKPEFVLHPFSGIIAFRPIHSRFTSNQFRAKFASLVEASFDNFFISTKIETINEEFEIQDQFKKFRTIICISLDLHPSNPHNRDIWKSLDNRIKNIDAINFQQKVVGGSNGLDINAVEKDELYQGLVMASDGYGFASVDGVLEDGRSVTVTTSDNPTEAKVVLDENPENLINQLINTFQLIWNRTRNEHKGKSK